MIIKPSPPEELPSTMWHRWSQSAWGWLYILISRLRNWVLMRIDGIIPEEPATPLNHPDCGTCAMLFLERAADRTRRINVLREQLNALVNANEMTKHICYFVLTRDGASKCRLCVEIELSRIELNK